MSNVRLRITSRVEITALASELFPDAADSGYCNTRPTCTKNTVIDAVIIFHQLPPTSDSIDKCYGTFMGNR